MKIYKILLSFFFICTTITAASAKSDSLGLPGDNLDLAGVLELFKNSENPEEFEKALNKEDNKLNNLDLNGDNEIDYIRVTDHSKGDAHALVLQVPVNESESQDVAVIEIEKTGDNEANLQIVGDKDLYGENYILEPADETAEVKSAEKTRIVNVYVWTPVRYIYRPAYVVWVSPWKWRYYPVWWKPWKPVHWHHYHPHWKMHRYRHHRVHTHRVVVAHNVYYGHRVASKTVQQKHSPGPRSGKKQAVKNSRKSQKQMGKQNHTRKAQSNGGAKRQGKQGKGGGGKRGGRK